MSYQFHNLDFSINQQAAIVEYAEQRKAVTSDILQSSVERNIKVSFSWDTYHSCIQMSMTPKLEEHPFYGYIVCVRHSDVHTLGKILLWLHAEGWAQIEPPVDASSRYDW